jgi:tetratricopeptide (TPR) repeat protein
VEAQEAIGYDKTPSFVSDLQTLGMELYHTRQYRESIDAYQKALQYHSRLKDVPEDEGANINSMFLFNTLGLSYQKIGQYDSLYSLSIKDWNMLLKQITKNGKADQRQHGG